MLFRTIFYHTKTFKLYIYLRNMKIMTKKNLLFIGIFALVLILYAVFSTKILFHDTFEYITIAKNLAGINNINPYVTHSVLYPLFMSFFLRIWPSLITVKLINVFWVFLIGLTLLIWLKDKKTFVIFVFSPIVWYTGIQTTPILPATFFFLLAFIFFKEKKIKHNQIYSGLFFGLSLAIYNPIIYILVLFIIFYFWNEKFSSLVKYIIMVFIGLIPLFIIDYYLFGNPLFTTIKHIGILFVEASGIKPSSGNMYILGSSIAILMLFIISPLLFKLYKIDIKENKKDILFLIAVSVFFLMVKNLVKYFFIITPLIIFLLSKVLNKKEVKWHAVISVFITVIMIFGFFGATNDVLIEKDLNKIISENNPENIIVTGFQANHLATFIWKDNPRFIWSFDYNAGLDNTVALRQYNFELNKNQKLNSREIFGISAYLKGINSQAYENPVFVGEKKSGYEGYEELKCYDVLCVYQTSVED